MSESYSVNQLKTWEKCQKKYEYDYVRKLSWPSNPKNFRLGRGVHQLMDYAARNLPLNPILDTLPDKDILEVWHLLKESHWTKLPVIASEWGFSLEIEGNWIYGRIDRIVSKRVFEKFPSSASAVSLRCSNPHLLRVNSGSALLAPCICSPHETSQTPSKNGYIHVLDWKTGTGIPAIPEEDWQTRIYLYAVYKAQEELGLSIPADKLIFTYVQARSQSIKEVQLQYSMDFHLKTAKVLAETLKIIQNTSSYQLPQTCPDRFCPYSNVCGIKPKLIDNMNIDLPEDVKPEPLR